MSASYKNELQSAIRTTVQEIMYGELIFLVGILAVFVVAHLFIKSEFVQTIGVEAVMTIITFIMLFFIPYLAFAVSFVQMLLIIIPLSISLAVLIVLIGYQNHSTT